MSHVIAAIEVGKLPWIAAMFLLANWKTGIAAVWGLGFASILARKMRQWYKDDAHDASLGVKDEDAIFSNMKAIAKERRPERLKKVFKRDLFWLPWLAYDGSRKLARIVFYPILAYLDKAQTEGLKEGRQDALSPLPAKNVNVLVEGENASKCMNCGFLVAYDDPHKCTKPHLITGPSFKKPKQQKEYVYCEECDGDVMKDQPHSCKGRLPKGTVKCECGAVYKEEADFDHVCPEESEEVMAQCKDCETEYDPTLELHVIKHCRGCMDVHCKKFDCGQRIS